MMKIIEESHKSNWYHSKIFSHYFEGLTPAVIDIETTGLSPASSQVILGGILIPQGETLLVRQFFAEDPREEEDLLALYQDAIAEADVLITYNGKGFDLPFLEKRLELYQQPSSLSRLQSFDLYRAVHHHSRLRDVLPDLKQKTLERFLGLSDGRKDLISGQDSVRLYMNYLKRKDSSLFRQILLHNRDDLVQLSSLLKILDSLDLHRILYYEGFSILCQDRLAVTQRVRIGKNTLSIEAKTTGLPFNYTSFTTACHATHHAYDRKIVIDIPVKRYQDAVYVDIAEIPGLPSTLESSPYVVDNFLILRRGPQIHYREVNSLIHTLIWNVLNFFPPTLKDVDSI